MEKSELSAIAERIVALFVTIKNATFIGVRNYVNEAKEISNYVLIADFLWVRAVETTIAILKSLTDADFDKIAETYGCCNTAGIVYSNRKEGKLYLETGKLPKEGTKARDIVLGSIKTTKTLAEFRDDMIAQFVANLNPETQSTQSLAQAETYERLYHNGKIVPSIKIHRETRKVYIWAMAHSKRVIVEGEYKDKDSKLETLQRIAIEKYCKYVLNAELPTTKYRNLVVDEEQMSKVVAMGEEITLAE